MTALQLERWHNWHNDAPKPTKIHIDCKQLLNELNWNEKTQAQEEAVLASIPHLRLTYEEDFLLAENHQLALNKIFDFINIHSVPVKTSLRRTGTDRLADSIENYDEVINIVGQTRFTSFLDSIS